MCFCLSHVRLSLCLTTTSKQVDQILPNLRDICFGACICVIVKMTRSLFDSY